MYPGKLTESELLLERERLAGLLERREAVSKDIRRLHEVDLILSEFTRARAGV